MADLFESAVDVLLGVLSGPGPDPPEPFATEDFVFSALTGPELAGRLPEALTSNSNITGHEEVAGLVAALRPRCRLPDAAVQAVFGLQVERERTIFLWPQPLHYAVIHSNARLARMLLAAAARVGALEECLGCPAHQGRPGSPSPLFLAVLVSEPEIVELLRQAGSTPNEVDARAAARLRRAGLWTALKDRMEELQLGAEFAQLEAKLGEMGERAKKTRFTIGTRRGG